MQGGAFQVGGAHAPEEFHIFRLETVGRARLRAPLGRQLGRHVQQQGEGGRKPLQGPGFQGRKPLGGYAASAALIGMAGVMEAVGQHPAPCLQRGLDESLHMFDTRGVHQQQFRIGSHGPAQQQAAQLLSQRRAARLAREQQVDAALAQMAGDELDVRALAGAVQSLQGDEAARPHEPRALIW